MGSKPATVTPENPQTVANAQEQAGKSAAATSSAYSNPALQQNQFGNQQRFYQVGTDANGNPIFNQVDTLGATGQQFATGFSGLGQQYGQLASQFAGQAPPDSNAAFDKAYTAATAMSAPQQQRQTEQLDTQLRNQGLVPGMPGYDNAILDLRNSHSQANNTLMAGIQGQLFNQGLQGLGMQENSLSLLQPGVQYGMQSIGAGYNPVAGINVQPPNVAQIYNDAENQQLQNAKIQNDYNSALYGAGGQILGMGLSGLGAYYGIPGFGKK